MNIVKGLKGSHKSNDYHSVEDQKDLRIPVQNEDAFKVGIVFKAKYIGTQEITRPSNRVEIVSAMRRIRYEYKYRNIKKRKVNIVISVNGIKVTIWKKKKSIHDGKYTESQLFVMGYPINRVFYVSHDSQDLLILSYIARGDDGIFRCSVFKAFRKAQAMSVVRTIGQAFEVCHKLNHFKNVEGEKENIDNENEPTPRSEDNDMEHVGDEIEETDIDDLASPISSQNEMTQNLSTAVETDLDQVKEGVQTTIPKIPTHLLNGKAGSDTTIPLTLIQMQQLYHQHMVLKNSEVSSLQSQLNMLKQQMKIEVDCRVDAQSRVEQLLAQNRELLVTVQKLMSQLENVPATNLFDPVNESWILSSGAPSDCFMPARSLPTLTNDITKECLSNIFDNQHYQSMDLGSGHSDLHSSPNNHQSNSRFQLQKDQTEDQNGALNKNQLTFVEFSKNASDNKSDIRLTEDVKEGRGGLSTSFTDLRTIGTADDQIDHNHNNDHITKFSTNTNIADTNENQMKTRKEEETEVTEENHIFSKEMLETFSEELNDLEVLIPK